MTLTKRQREALIVLAEHDSDTGLSPAQFAMYFWPGKVFARGNGPWGLGPDASGRHGGKMLTRLERMGMVNTRDRDGYYTARINNRGRRAIADE